MYIKSFSVTNYRNIVETQTINLDENLTILVGKNNEGKSNILQALNTFFAIIKQSHYDNGSLIYPYRSFRFFNKTALFSPERDFPKKSKDGVSRFEILLNNDIQIILTVFVNTKTPSRHLRQRTSVEIYQNNKKISYKEQEKLLDKFRKEIKYQYMPAIRNDSLAYELINNIISLELNKLAPKRQKQLEKVSKDIEKLQKRALENIKINLKKTLKTFIPNFKDIDLLEEENDKEYIYRRYLDNNSYKIDMNDGFYNTDLRQKGDGIKNLFCIGMIGQNTKERIGKGLILAIEEPESHLHPNAVRQLNDIIRDISKKNQIILTTHSPLFVNTDNISANIIVDNGKVRQVNDIEEIRKELGVQINDNLIHSEYIILVEGETDKIILNKILSDKSKKLKQLLKNKLLSLHAMKGASNLKTEINFFNTMIVSKLCCVLDNDTAGINAVVAARKESLISKTENELFFFKVKGKKYSELEDFINPEFYQEYLKKQYFIDFSSTRKTNIWNKRLAEAFTKAGKEFNDNIKEDIKIYIARLVEEKGLKILLKKGTSFNGLVEGLEKFFNV